MASSLSISDEGNDGDDAVSVSSPVIAAGAAVSAVGSAVAVFLGIRARRRRNAAKAAQDVAPQPQPQPPTQSTKLLCGLEKSSLFCLDMESGAEEEHQTETVNPVVGA